MTQVRNLLRYACWPILFVLFVASYAYSQQLGIEPGVALLAVTIGHFVLIAILELFIPARPDWSWTNDLQVFNDVVHGLLLDVGARLGAAIIALLILIFVVENTGFMVASLWPDSLPLWGQIAIAILLYDFFDYWKHRAYHRFSWLWPIHALHHNPTRMHIFKAGRLHFLEATVRVLISSGPLLVLGAPQEVVFWIAALSNVVGNQNHWNVDSRLPRFMHLCFATPQIHWEHHAIEYKRHSVNLSPFTMLFDHLFGTYQAPMEGKVKNVGIDPNPIAGNIFRQLLSPLTMNVAKKKRTAARAPDS
jgi:ornithine lipid hydroxylase